MSTVRENLFAARALIDTPTKQMQIGIYGALREVARGEANEAFEAMQAALRAQLPEGHHGMLTRLDRPKSHRKTMDLFDRAIAAQEPTP